MPILGSHLSIAGGYYKAVEAAHAVGCDCVQLFTKNNNQWRAKPISPEEVSQFRDALASKKISHPLSHASYLINMASPDIELWQKSVEAMVVELQRADQLGIPYVVVHPGSHTTGTEEEGIALIVKALDEIAAQTKNLAAIPLLENVAGQGSNLGWKFEQLGAMLDGVKDKSRLGVCFDTCHAFAAGYPLGTPEDYKSTWKQFDSAVGIELIKAFHLNDSKRELGSRVDRHEHIGEGEMGLEPFRLLLANKRFRKVPMYLETAKEKNAAGEEWDAVNLRVLRGLVE
jgi:deoxyribonuclease IV